jgi:DnaJ like chaperone protein
MSVWGKIIGGAAGFAIGGPLGALLGAVAGHAVDELRNVDAGSVPPEPGLSSGRDSTGSSDPGRPDPTRSIAFTVGVIVLGAKMAKADGVVHKLEVDAFKRVFQVPADEMTNVGRLFNIARRDSAGFEPYARQLAQMFADRPQVLEELIGGLFYIAKADHVLHAEEIRFLQAVSTIFGFDGAAFDRLRQIHGAGSAGRNTPERIEPDPWNVLGVPPGSDLTTVKAAYRQLVRQNHPDSLMAQGMPAEFIAVAQEKMSAINSAFETIERRLRAGGDD